MMKKSPAKWFDGSRRVPKRTDVEKSKLTQLKKQPENIGFGSSS